MFRGWCSVGVGDRDDRRIVAVLAHCGVLGSRSASRGEFEELARSVHGDLHGYLRQQVGPSDVDDVLSEALTTAWRRWSDAPATGDRQRAWVFGIAQNKVRELYRANERRLRLGAALCAQVTRQLIPAEEVVADDRVRWFLEQLPAHERASVYLVTICGFTAKEAGQILGHPSSTVSGHVTRALHRLRPLVGSQTGGGDVFD